ncbi:MAG: GNAT family N-acetyltransferase [Chloroflexi bacterium]|nr:GNAT family N-acetyltransferase [Chloroflexota bacterium]
MRSCSRRPHSDAVPTKTSPQPIVDGWNQRFAQNAAAALAPIFAQPPAYAQQEGYQSVRLGVIETNPAAQRLYERVGFVSIKTEHFAYLKWLLGFGAATEMAFDLHAKV